VKLLKGLGKGLLLGLIIYSEILLWAQERPPVEQWWELGVFDDETLERMDRVGDQIPYVIFKALNDLTLFSGGNDQIEISLSAHRRIFENHERSWTVADRVRVQGSIPLFSQILNGASSATGTLGFSIGSSVGVDFINLRQVTPEGYGELPDIQEKDIDLSETDWQTDKGTWVYQPTPQGQSVLNFLPFHPDNQMRYDALWKLPLIPFKLPLRADGVASMADKEIISYVGFGGLQLGPSVGWSLDPTQLTFLSQEVLSYTTFVNGSFRISIMKEPNNYVRLKVTRIGEMGHGGSLIGTEKPTVLEGMIIVKYLSSATKIIPFNVKINQSLAKSFDVSYRYDLNIPNAREAYEQAVLGRTALSDELAFDEFRKPTLFEKTGVQKLAIRNSWSDDQHKSRLMRLGFIFKRKSETTFKNIDSVITLPDGKHHVFNSIVDNSDYWHVVFSFFEKFQHRFNVSVDLDKYREDSSAHDALSLTVSGSIHDSDTSSTEMLNYILEVENSVGRAGVFPRPPTSNTYDLGSSRFFYRIGIGNQTLEDFVNTDEGEMWPLLEEAFQVWEGYWSNPVLRALYQVLSLPITLINVPLYIADVNLRSGSNLLHARSMRSRWLAIREFDDIKERAEAIGHLFFDRQYSYELIRLLRGALNEREVGYAVSGYTSYMGQVIDQGRTELFADNKATEYQREIDYDSPGQGRLGFNELKVSGLEISTEGKDKVVITFSLSHVPHALFFQLSLNNPWWVFSNGLISHVLIYNHGVFVVGKNKVIINRSDVGNPWYPLIEKLETDNRYSLQITANHTGLKWGSAVENTFRVP
jgi:hypothetical protein